MKDVLYYPKNMFRQCEVERMMRNFQFPLAWDLQVESMGYKLTLNKRKMEKFYVNVRR